MRKFVIVFCSFWLIGFFVGMHIAGMRKVELKEPQDFVSYMNEKSIPTYDSGVVKKVEMPLCQATYEYDSRKDSLLPPFINTTYKKESRLGFKEASSESVVELLSLLGVAGLPAIRENAYAIVKKDWRFSIVAALGGGVGIGLGYWLKYKTVCDSDNKAFVDYINDKQNWRSYVRGLESRSTMAIKTDKGIIIPVKQLPKSNLFRRTVRPLTTVSPSEPVAK